VISGHGWILSEVLQEFCSGGRAFDKTASEEVQVYVEIQQTENF